MTQVRTRWDDAQAEAAGGVVVRRPRATDAIGHALRRAFAADDATPREWARAMEALDGVR